MFCRGERSPTLRRRTHVTGIATQLRLRGGMCSCLGFSFSFGSSRVGGGGGALVRKRGHVPSFVKFLKRLGGNTQLTRGPGKCIVNTVGEGLGRVWRGRSGVAGGFLGLPCLGFGYVLV